MKLRNKLMPLMALATTSMVVAPIATSCGNSTTAEDTLDITSPYTPTIAKAEKTGSEENPVDVAKATDIYMKDVMENPDILKQDIWYYEAKKLPERISLIEHTSINIDGEAEEVEEPCNAVTDVTATVNVSGVEVKKHEAIIQGVKTEFYTISMDLGYEFKFTATSFTTEPRVQLTKSASFKSTYKDVPFYMYKSASQWFVSIDLLSKEIDEYLKQLPNWSLDCAFSTNYDCAVTTHGLTQHFTDSRSISDHIVRRSQVRSIAQREQDYWGKGYYTLLGAVSDMYLNFVSYHMLDVATPADMVSLSQPTEKIYATQPSGYRYTWDFENGQTAGIFKSNDEAKARTAKANNVYLQTYSLDYDSWWDGFKYNEDSIDNPTIYSTDTVSEIGLGNSNALTKTSDNELLFNYFYVRGSDCYTNPGDSLNFVIPAGTIYRVIWENDSDYVTEDITVSSDFKFSITLAGA